MKKHCISYPTKSLIFCKSLLFFRIKQELLIVYSYKFICVYIVSFYANNTKNWNTLYHCRFTQSKPNQESHVAVLKNCFMQVLQMDIFPEC